MILQVKKVNGVEVDNLKHLRQLVEDGSSENIRFDLDDERVIVLNYKKARIATSRILNRHRIPSATSADLIDDHQTVSDIQLPWSKWASYFFVYYYNFYPDINYFLLFTSIRVSVHIDFVIYLIKKKKQNRWRICIEYEKKMRKFYVYKAV